MSNQVLQIKARYRIDEACQELGISRRTLYRRISEGKLTLKKDGACSYIPGAEFARYAAGEQQ